MISCGDLDAGAGKGTLDDALLGAFKENSSANDRAISRPGQGLQCAISDSGRCSVHFEGP
jgi:hypothetical protein